MKHGERYYEMWGKIKPYLIGFFASIGAAALFIFGRQSIRNDNDGDNKRITSELENQGKLSQSERDSIERERVRLDEERKRLASEGVIIERDDELLAELAKREKNKSNS